jgi:hypothetical protein
MNNNKFQVFGENFNPNDQSRILAQLLAGCMIIRERMELSKHIRLS